MDNTQDKQSSQSWTVVDTLEEFRKTTRKKGWNGYDAEPLSDRVIDNAIALVRTLSDPPDVYPVATGNIQMEWDRLDGGYLEVTVKEDPSEVDLYIEIPKQDYNKSMQRVPAFCVKRISTDFKKVRMVDM